MSNGASLSEIQTPYQVTAIKRLPSGGKVVIYGMEASTIGQAEQNLKIAMQEYMATGAWGGSGLKAPSQ